MIAAAGCLCWEPTADEEELNPCETVYTLHALSLRLYGLILICRHYLLLLGLGRGPLLLLLLLGLLRRRPLLLAASRNLLLLGIASWRQLLLAVSRDLLLLGVGSWCGLLLAACGCRLLGLGVG